MTQLTYPLDRRSGQDRRRPDRRSISTHMDDASPISDWPLHVPDPLRQVRTSDAWARVVHLTILDACCDAGVDAAAAWEDAAAWHVAGFDPTSGDDPRSGTIPHDAVGTDAIRTYHRELARLTDGTYRQELVSVESGRGPLVEAHVRTTARRGDKILDIPTLLAFELPSLRIRRVTEIPGDLPAWDAFWAR